MDNTSSTSSTPHNDDTSNTTSHLSRRIQNIDMAEARSQDRSLYRYHKSARVRYMTISIENDQVGDITITAMIDECIQLMQKYACDLGYVSLVFRHILDQISRKKLGNPERARNVNELLRFARSVYEWGEYNSVPGSRMVRYGVPFMNAAEDAIFMLDPNLHPDWL